MSDEDHVWRVLEGQRKASGRADRVTKQEFAREFDDEMAQLQAQRRAEASAQRSQEAAERAAAAALRRIPAPLAHGEELESPDDDPTGRLLEAPTAAADAMRPAFRPNGFRSREEERRAWDEADRAAKARSEDGSAFQEIPQMRESFGTVNGLIDLMNDGYDVNAA
jgi:hypothetical protein